MRESMKYSKRYIIFALILCVIFTTRFQILGGDEGRVGEFRGAILARNVWTPLMAQDVNGRVLKVVIDNKEYTSDKVRFFMNEDGNIMVPVSILRDAMNCSSHLYDNSELLVEKRNLFVKMTRDSDMADTNDGRTEIISAMRKYENEFYVSLNDLSELLGYNCSFDITKNMMTVIDTSENPAVIPTRYDLRNRKRVSTIRDQGSYGTCWAFAAVSAMESGLLPEEEAQFSVDHMTMSNSFQVNQYDGGEYTMGMAYLAAWQGPVYEADDPYGDGKTEEEASPVKHVQQIRLIDGKDYDGIKTAVFKYGGVQTSLYSTLRSSSKDSRYYNSGKSAYCYIGTERPNHDVVIIGWDDNYPKENFQVDLEGDGAFICQNSWGEDFGENGVFYVSYYDTNIGTHNVIYTGVESVDNYDHIYQSDLCGWVGKIGYSREHIYGANVFTAKGDESIEAASFYATGAGTEYAIFVVNDFENEDSFSRMQKVASGVLEQSGYYTINFNNSVSVEEGERYAIVLYIKTPGSRSPLAIEYDSGDKALSTVDLTDGEGYISYNGTKFVNVKQKSDCNLCIKAFTKER